MAQARGDTWWSRTIGDDNAATLLSFLQPKPDANIPQTAVVVRPAGGISAQFVTPIIFIGVLVVAFLLVRKLS